MGPRGRARRQNGQLSTEASQLQFLKETLTADGHFQLLGKLIEKMVARAIPCSLRNKDGNRTRKPVETGYGNYTRIQGNRGNRTN